MKLNWNFRGGGGGGGRGWKAKNLPWGSMDICWNCTLNIRGWTVQLRMVEGSAHIVSNNYY